MFSGIVKSFEFILKTNILEGLAACADGKVANKISTIIHESISNSVEKQCRIYARKNDANMMEDGWKMDAKLEPKSINNMENRVPKTMPPKTHARVPKTGSPKRMPRKQGPQNDAHKNGLVESIS